MPKRHHLFIAFAALALAVTPAVTALACANVGAGQRFVAEPDLGLIDETTGLVWQACLAGQKIKGEACSGKPLHLSWLDADAFASDLADVSQGDWRLPTLDDLETIVDRSCAERVLPEDFAIEGAHQIWTASPGFPVNDVAAVMDLDSGKIWGVGKGVRRHFLLVTDDPR